MHLETRHTSDRDPRGLTKSFEVSRGKARHVMYVKLAYVSCGSYVLQLSCPPTRISQVSLLALSPCYPTISPGHVWCHLPSAHSHYRADPLAPSLCNPTCSIGHVECHLLQAHSYHTAALLALSPCYPTLPALKVAFGKFRFKHTKGATNSWQFFATKPGSTARYILKVRVRRYAVRRCSSHLWQQLGWWSV